MNNTPKNNDLISALVDELSSLSEDKFWELVDQHSDTGITSMFATNVEGLPVRISFGPFVYDVSSLTYSATHVTYPTSAASLKPFTNDDVITVQQSDYQRAS